MMAKNVKFVLNRRAFREQILQGRGVDMESALREGLKGGDDIVIEVSNNARGGGRMRARVYGSMADEAAHGVLSKRLGGQGMVRYTTKDGRQRWASQAQVDNWTRGRR